MKVSSVSMKVAFFGFVCCFENAGREPKVEEWEAMFEIWQAFSKRSKEEVLALFGEYGCEIIDVLKQRSIHWSIPYPIWDWKQEYKIVCRRE